MTMIEASDTESAISETAKTTIRKRVVQESLLEFGVTQEDFYGVCRTAPCVAARVRAARALYAAGFNMSHIARIMRRDPSTVRQYFPSNKNQRRHYYATKVITRLLAADLCEVMETIAKAEDVTIETLIAQWVGERAEYELAAKARAA